MLLVLAPVAGLALGSFANVLGSRMPRRESLVKPRSRCPDCGAQVRGYDNVPVLSWFLLRGHCRDCGGGGPARDPPLAVAAAPLWVGAAPPPARADPAALPARRGAHGPAGGGRRPHAGRRRLDRPRTRLRHAARAGRSDRPR